MPNASRKIGAILSADVVDYSRFLYLGGVDDEKTLSVLKDRRATFDRLVKEFQGQEFGSVSGTASWRSSPAP